MLGYQCGHCALNLHDQCRQMVSITCQKRATGIPDRDSLKYHLQHFKLARTLIEGAFGKVVLAEHTRENKMYEVKVLKNDLKLSDELIVLGSKSRFLLNIHSYFQLSNLLVLTTEHIPGNSLLFHLSVKSWQGSTLLRLYLVFSTCTAMVLYTNTLA